MNLVAIKPQNLGKIFNEMKNNKNLVILDGSRPIKGYKFRSGSPIENSAKVYIENLAKLPEGCGNLFARIF